MTECADSWTEGVLFQKLLDETVDLMRQTQDYIARIEASARPVECPTDRRDRLAVVRECSTMTAHLTAVMGWLLTHRARAEGHVEDPAVSSPSAPVLIPVSVLPPPRNGEVLGPRGEALKTRAATLYSRVHRLAEQLSLREKETVWKPS